MNEHSSQSKKPDKDGGTYSESSHLLEGPSQFDFCSNKSKMEMEQS